MVGLCTGTPYLPVYEHYVYNIRVLEFLIRFNAFMAKNIWRIHFCQLHLFLFDALPLCLAEKYSVPMGQRKALCCANMEEET